MTRGQYIRAVAKLANELRDLSKEALWKLDTDDSQTLLFRHRQAEEAMRRMVGELTEGHEDDLRVTD